MQQLGKYQIVGVIGEGGMGTVYRARDAVIGRDVAIKVIRERALNVPEVKDRFYREAQAAGRLAHENIMVIHDIGEDDGAPYIVMEYLTGTDLRHVLDSGTQLPVDQKLLIAMQICDGLLYAHEHEVVHRDIKPDNIRILRGNRVKIMDFGIARLTADVQTLTHASLGTPRYMSPEQIKGVRVDRRSDIFSFGVLFYEMITGSNPFWGEHVTTVIYKILHEDPEPISIEDADLAADLQAIISRCLRKDVAERYQSLAPVLDDLRAAYMKRQAAGSAGPVPTHVLRDETVVMPSLEPGQREPTGVRSTGAPVRKRRVSVPRPVLAAFSVIAVIVALLVILLPDRSGSRTPPTAGMTTSPLVVEQLPDAAALRDEALALERRMVEERARAEEANASAGEGSPLAEAIRLEDEGRAALERGGDGDFMAAADAFERATQLYSEASIEAAGADAAALQAQASEAQAEADRARRLVADAAADPAVSQQFARADRGRGEGVVHMQQGNYSDAIRIFRQSAAEFAEVRRVVQRRNAQRTEAEEFRTQMQAAAGVVAGARTLANYQNLFRQADAHRDEGSSHFSSGTFDRATISFQAAAEAYRGIATAREEELAGAVAARRRQAEQARAAMQEARNQVPGSLASSPEFQQAASAASRGEEALRTDEFDAAVRAFREASGVFTELSRRTEGPAPEVLAQRSVQDLVRRLKTGFEEKDLSALRAISPEFASWRDFFGVAHSISANVSSSEPEVSGDRARVQMQIQLNYMDNKNRSQRTPPLRQTWTLQRAGDEWVVAGVTPHD